MIAASRQEQEVAEVGGTVTQARDIKSHSAGLAAGMPACVQANRP